ncbi:actin patch assembly and actin polymerization protein [Salix suchowensis]|nr:actin patch assembly and actin polymerization protein [Salix suchowensis]
MSAISFAKQASVERSRIPPSPTGWRYSPEAATRRKHMMELVTQLISKEQGAYAYCIYSGMHTYTTNCSTTEASRALRKKLKHGGPHRQYRAMVVRDRGLQGWCAVDNEQTIDNVVTSLGLPNQESEATRRKRAKKEAKEAKEKERQQKEEERLRQNRPRRPAFDFEKVFADAAPCPFSLTTCVAGGERGTDRNVDRDQRTDNRRVGDVRPTLPGRKTTTAADETAANEVAPQMTGESEVFKLQEKQRAAIKRAKQDLNFGAIGGSAANLPPPMKPSGQGEDGSDEEPYNFRGSLSDFSDYVSSDEETHNASSSRRPRKDYVDVSDDPDVEATVAIRPQAGQDDPFADPFADEVAIGPTKR